MTTWTEERIELLKTLWAKGLGGEQVAEKLGITRNAVIGKIHRLKQPKRVAPRKTVKAPSKPKVNKDAATVRRVVRQAIKDDISPQTAVDILASEHGLIRGTAALHKAAHRMGLHFKRHIHKKGPATAQEKATALNISMRSRTTHRESVIALHGPEPVPVGTKEAKGCLFIGGDPHDPTWRYCGHPISHRKSSWCPWHLKLVSHPAQPVVWKWGT